MTDARFLSSKVVNCELNHVKFKILVQGSLTHKSPNICRNRSKDSPLRSESLSKSGNFQLLGPCTHPCMHRLRRNVAWPSELACQISRGSVQRVAPARRKCWFSASLSKTIPAGLWLRGILPVKHLILINIRKLLKRCVRTTWITLHNFNSKH